MQIIYLHHKHDLYKSISRIWVAKEKEKREKKEIISLNYVSKYDLMYIAKCLISR